MSTLPSIPIPEVNLADYHPTPIQPVEQPPEVADQIPFSNPIFDAIAYRSEPDNSNFFFNRSRNVYRDRLNKRTRML